LYALGVVLYELLTGRVPIEGRSNLETLRRLMIETPPPPSAHQKGIDRDLDAIVLRCLAKSPDDRYPTAEDLAEDLRRWRAGLPVQARQRPWGRRAWEHVVRMTRQLGGVAGVLAILGLLTTIAWMSRIHHRLRQQSDQARQQQRQAEQDAGRQAALVAAQQYAAALIAAAEAAQAGDYAFSAERLQGVAPLQGRADLRGWEWHYLHTLTTRPPTRECVAATELYQTALSPSGRELVAAGKDGSLRRYDAATLALLAAWPTGQGEINGVDVAPDGQRLATAGDDGTLCVLDAVSGVRRLRIVAGRVKAFGVRFYDQGRKLASCGEEPVIRLWDAATGQPLGVLEGHAASRQVEMLACSPDGRYLASAGSDATIVVWDLGTGQAVCTLRGHERTVASVAFSPDGGHLVSGSLDRTVRVWEVPTGRPLAMAMLLNPVQCVALVAEGRVVLTGDRAGCLRRFRLSRTPLKAPHVTLTPDEDHARWYAHAGRVWSLCPGHEGDAWFSTGGDGRVRAWAADRLPAAQRTIVASAQQPMCDVAYTPDGAQLLVLDESSGITVYDARGLRPLRRLSAPPGGWCSLHVLYGREEVAAGNAHGSIALWNYRRGGPPRATIDLGAATKVSDLAFDPATQHLVVLPRQPRRGWHAGRPHSHRQPMGDGAGARRPVPDRGPAQSPGHVRTGHGSSHPRIRRPRRQHLQRRVQPGWQAPGSGRGRSQRALVVVGRSAAARPRPALGRGPASAVFKRWPPVAHGRSAGGRADRGCRHPTDAAVARPALRLPAADRPLARPAAPGRDRAAGPAAPVDRSRRGGTARRPPLRGRG
jgi:WD40 repeat protein